MHKENDDQVHEDIEVDATRAKNGGMNNHDQTLNKGMISKKDRILLVCATKIKDYGLTTPKDRSTHIKENFDVGKVTAVKLRNSMKFTDEDESIYDSHSLH